MGDWKNFLWAWFPIGFVGIRALFLCIPALLVYLLRITQWHIGRRNTKSPLDTLRQCILTRRFTGTLFLYSLSAFLYCEVYIWAQAKNSLLEVTTPGKLHERTKLNERPIYLRFLFIMLAVVQSIFHLYKDYDRVEVPVGTGQTAAHSELRLVHILLPLASTAFLTATVAFLVGSLVYNIAFRNQIWTIWYSFMKQFVNLGKTSKPAGLAPFASLICIFLAEGTLLLFLWQFSNAAFNILMSKEPLKNGKPVTNDSKDPNGSLLNGLKSKKDDNKVCCWYIMPL
jgi:nucleoporin NDC1